MAGIYIHIPFCRKACHYCNFHFSTNQSTKTELVKSLVDEMKIRRHYLSPQNITSIYFGGGTPSLLEEDEFQNLVETIYKNFKVVDQPEITIEANPEDLTIEKLQTLKKQGVNRLSIGIQSIHDVELSFMNRAHNSLQSYDAIKRSQDLGFENISIDLMFGLINSNMKMWEENLQFVIDNNIPHISCYNLTIEEQTALAKWVELKKVKMPNEYFQKEQFEKAHEIMASHGFEHYEISNYARPSYKSQHNSNYWEGVPYMGIGPAAHSFNGRERSWNIANNNLYIQSIKNGHIPNELEELDEKDRYNEAIMLALRTAKGWPTSSINAFNFHIQNHWKSLVHDKIKAGIIIEQEGQYKLALDYWYISDTIIEDLFYAN